MNSMDEYYGGEEERKSIVILLKQDNQMNYDPHKHLNELTAVHISNTVII